MNEKINCEIENELTETELEETNGGMTIGTAIVGRLIGWGIYKYFSSRN